MKIAFLGLTLLMWVSACGFEPPQSAELTDRDTIKTQVSNLFAAERFADLEAMAESFRTTKARTSSGVWKLGFFYSSLERVFPRQDQPQAFWDFTGDYAQKWVAQYPNSPSARLAYATMLINRAWSIRGTGYASTVNDDAWTPFFEKVEEARRYLIEIEDIASSDPYWYSAMAEVATMQGWPEAEFSALLHEALDREPLYYDIYFQAANRYLPKWGGSAEQVEALAREAVERTKTPDGFGVYARIYWSASGSQYQDDLFQESDVDWQTMKRGIDDVLEQYPDDWNLNHFAKFACLAGDYDKASELIDRLKSKPLPLVWGPYWYLERCQLMAMFG